MKKNLLPLGALLLLSWQPALTQINGDWITDGNGNWSDPTRWSSNPHVPDGDGSIVNLTFALTANRTVTIDTPSRTVGQLTIGDPNGAFRYDLNASGGAGLTFQNGGSAAQLNFTSTALTGTVSAPISLADNLTVSNDSANQQTISSTISASAAGLKTIEFGGSGGGLVSVTGTISDGTGQVGIRINNASGGGLFLSTIGTFTGPVEVQAGRLILNGDLGTRPVNITGGSIASNGGNPRDILGNVTLNGIVSLGDATNVGSVRFNEAASTFELLGNSTISNPSTVVMAHQVTGAFSLTKNGAGILTVTNTSANNTFSGGFNLEAGQVRVLNNDGLGTGTITLTGGIFNKNSGAARSFANIVSIGGNIGFGDGAFTGALTFSGATTLTANSVLTTQLNTTFSNTIDGSGFGITKDGSGTLTLSGANSYTGATFVSAGSLIIGSAGSINTSSQVTVSDGATLTLNNNTTNLTTALGLRENATLAGTGTFAPVSMTLVADLTGGEAFFSSINTGTTSVVRSGNMEFTLTNPTAGNYDIFNGSNISGSFSSISIGGVALDDMGGGVFGGAVGSFIYTFDNSNNLLSLSVIPEPSAWVLIAFGVLIILYTRRRVAFRS
jgi:fibronectin-binding autotransporter adhesin